METAMSLDTSEKTSSERAVGGKRVWLQRITAWSAAAVLLAAAILKGWPLATGQAVETQVASLLKLLLIQGELLLALWLISGIGAAWAFRAALVFFAGAAAVNLRSIWLGEVSCGCYGNVEAPPLVSLGLNSALLTGLIVMRPNILIWAIKKEVLIAGGAIVGAVLLTVGWNGLQKRLAMIEVNNVDLGTLTHSSSPRIVSLKVSNSSGRSVSIVGYVPKCNCLVPAENDLPASIPPGESIKIDFMFTPDQPGRFSKKVILITDSEYSSNISAAITGIVVGSG